MDLSQDFTFYMDPKIATTTPTAQASCGFVMCVNSLYPFQESALTTSRVNASGQTLNCQVPGYPAATWPVEYNLDSPNPSAAWSMKGVYNQGDYSIGRKFQRAMITGARVETFVEPVVPATGIVPVQPGILTQCTHNTPTLPINIGTTAVDLKLVAPRKCRRVNATYTLSPADSGASAINSSGLARQTKLNTNISVKKMYNVADLLDNEEEFGFSTGLDSSTGTTVSAGNPENRCYVSTFITPSLTESITGDKVQAPACLIRIRLKQRILFTKPRSHSQVSGVDWNLPRPRPALMGAIHGASAAATLLSLMQ